MSIGPPTSPQVEKEEERAAIQQPDKQQFHLCIINLVIGTLYCAKVRQACMITCLHGTVLACCMHAAAGCRGMRRLRLSLFLVSRQLMGSGSNDGNRHLDAAGHNLLLLLMYCCVQCTAALFDVLLLCDRATTSLASRASSSRWSRTTRSWRRTPGSTPSAASSRSSRTWPSTSSCSRTAASRRSWWVLLLWMGVPDGIGAWVVWCGKGGKWSVVLLRRWWR